MSTPDVTPSSNTPVIPYVVSWWIGTSITVLLGVWFILGPALESGNGPPLPSWLAAWLPYIFAGIALLGRFFPSQQQTVGSRIRAFRRAAQGQLPPDVPPLSTT